MAKLIIILALVAALATLAFLAARRLNQARNDAEARRRLEAELAKLRQAQEAEACAEEERKAREAEENERLEREEIERKARDAERRAQEAEFRAEAERSAREAFELAEKERRAREEAERQAQEAERNAQEALACVEAERDALKAAAAKRQANVAFHALNGWNEECHAGTRKTITANGVELAFRYCPAKTAEASPASEEEELKDETQDSATLTNGFWFLETLVTRATLKKVTRRWPALWGDGDNASDRLPANNTSREECEKFIENLNASARLPVGVRFRFPTETEWRYAFEAGASVRAEAKEKSDVKHPWGLDDMFESFGEWALQDGASAKNPRDSIKVDDKYCVMKRVCYRYNALFSKRLRFFDVGLRIVVSCER